MYKNINYHHIKRIKVPREQFAFWIFGKQSTFGLWQLPDFQTNAAM